MRVSKLEWRHEDHASGKTEERPGLEALRKALCDGDTLVVWKLDRLGRDLRDLVGLTMAATGQPGTRVGDLCKELGITRQTLYRHIAPEGTLREDGQKRLHEKPG